MTLAGVLSSQFSSNVCFSWWTKPCLPWP